MGDGFTAAAFLLTVGGIPLTLWGAAHLGNCSCWSRWKKLWQRWTKRPNASKGPQEIAAPPSNVHTLELLRR